VGNSLVGWKVCETLTLRRITKGGSLREHRCEIDDRISDQKLRRAAASAVFPWPTPVAFDQQFTKI
jgi:hypothetical protein